MAETELLRQTKIEIFRAVLALDPKAPIFVELAETLMEDGRPEEAIKVCREGLIHHPDLLAGQVALVEVLLAAGREEEAREALGAATRQAARASQSMSRLRELEARLGAAIPAGLIESAEASGAGEEDWSDQPASDLASPTLADLYVSQGQPEAAIGVYKRLLAKDPANKAVRAKLKALGATPSSQASLKLLDALVKWQSVLQRRGVGPQV
ncbi:MAG: tetratricopeptide repeat protein [Deltaproteobacteria bacterium]|nr:tetratricopeptide repeat protein [Deltaproteobacteria bacterium]